MAGDLNAFVQDHPVAAPVIILIGALVLVPVLLALGVAILALTLNVIGGFGLSLGALVGLELAASWELFGIARGITKLLERVPEPE